MESGNQSLKILAVSDEVVERFYSAHVRKLFPEIELIVSCGDLPYYYLEYMLDMLNKPMFFVHGNHDPEVEMSAHGKRRYPWGATNLDQKFVWFKGLIFFGLEGCVRYSKGEHQFTQLEMWLKVLRAVPRMLYNRIRHGRALDVFISHSPSRHLGDAEDPAHQGFESYRWLLKVFKPKYHIHGHIHIYDRNDFEPRLFEKTIILNTCSYQRLEIDLQEDGKDE